MRILIAAVGKLKDEEERGIVDRYGRRFDLAGKALGLGPLSITELAESRVSSAAARKADEAARLWKLCGGASIKIVLDAGGRSYDSEAFAKLLRTSADGGAKTAAFMIGGPDGHGEPVLTGADIKLSLGPMTLPHGLARVLLTEQLYRAATILAGHPYHRA